MIEEFYENIAWDSRGFLLSDQLGMVYDKIMQQ
jgi:hypothetical protein